MGSLKNLAEVYKKRSTDYADRAMEEKKKFWKWAVLRVLLFFLGVGLIAFCFSIHPVAGIGAIPIWLIVLSLYVRWHSKFKERQGVYVDIVEINQREISAMNHDWQNDWTGRQFVDAKHTYASDLDLFGELSLFRLINRIGTGSGQRLLADWLKNPARLDEINQRQSGVKELRDEIDFRQFWFVFRNRLKNEEEVLDSLQSWIEEIPLFTSKKGNVLLLIVLPIVCAIAFVMALYTWPWYRAIWVYSPLVVFYMRNLKYIQATHRKTANNHVLIKQYLPLVKLLSTQRFKTEMLQLMTPSNVTSIDGIKAVEKLGYYIHQLNVRDNAFAILFNLAGLWDLIWVVKLERWKIKNVDLIRTIQDVFPRWDGLTCLSNLAFNQTTWVFPIIGEDQNVKLKGAGHPLIHHAKRITNDFELPKERHLMLLTGSNMAGKSTLLRTIGVNMVLARMGAPVCAEEASLPLIYPITSMRTQDDLGSSTSAFYAELKRLKEVLLATSRGEPVLFLLDEILKGTNSKDRHAGSKALIRQLISSGGVGVVATHDIELSSMSAEYPDQIDLKCLEVQVRNGEMYFDYKLKDGVTKSFNAVELMRSIGINLNAHE